MAIALWYLFDRSGPGFVLGLVVGVLGTAATGALVSAGAYVFTHADLFGVRSWIPCLLFSAGICIGTVARALAAWSSGPARARAA
jgi:hypothetical protein